MKIYAFYVISEEGICMFHMSFTATPDVYLVTAMLSAMQSFMHEVTGSVAKKIVAGDFVFHIEKVGRISFVLATSIEERPAELLTNLRTRFLHGYGSLIANWSGVVSKFTGFKKEAEEILNLTGIGKRIEPKQPLNAFVIMSLDEELQATARELIMMEEASPQEISDKLTQSLRITRSHLARLVNMEHIGRIETDDGYRYFISR